MTQTETQTRTSLDDLPLVDPSAPNVGAAIRRHPIILVLCVVLCLAAGAAAGLVRKPNYTANAKLQVGAINLKLPGAIGGLQTANEELATSYSREILAQPVVSSVARQLHLSQTTVLAALTATPVPQSGDFTITATNKSQNQVVPMVNDASDALIKYVASQNDDSGYVNHLWTQYQAAAKQVAAANVAVFSAHQTISLTKGHATTAQLNALAKAQADLDTASTNKAGISQAYYAAKSQANNTPVLITPALQATSDRATRLVIFLFGGLVAGLLIGTALATVRARRRAARMLG